MRLSVSLLACVSLGACAWLDDKRKVDYKNTRQLPPLEVPPDLRTTPDPATPATAPAQRTTYSEVVGDKQAGGSGAAPAVLPQVAGVTLERDGQTRWLLVQANVERLYLYVRQFVLDTGLTIDRESPTTGVIETGWVETPAKGNAGNAAPPAKWLRRFPSSATRDKFRIRLERGSRPDTTEVYIAHYGIADSGRGSGDARWQPRTPEPDVEAEMLRLLIAYLGRSDVQARSIIAQTAAPVTERAQLWRRGDSFMLSLEDSLDRAWRRVGLSLDRVGFTVEDRDRSKGIYYVRYLDPEKQAAEPGWFSRLFGADAKKSEERYQIRLQGAAGDRTQVMVRNSEGEPEFGTTSERILSLLYEQLK